MTAPASAYPRTVDELMPDARNVPVRDGERVPSQRRLMSTLSIGQEKAKEIRDRLLAEVDDMPAEPKLDPMDLTRRLVLRAEQTGETPTPADLVAEYGVRLADAELMTALVGVAVRRRAADLPTDIDDEPTSAASGSADIEPVDVPEWLTFPPAAPAASNGNGHRPDADYTLPVVDTGPEPVAPPAEPVEAEPEQVRAEVDTDGTAATATVKPVVVWPVWALMFSAFVSVWSGWVGLGERTGYGLMNLLPGFTDKTGGPLLEVNTAITLPIGMEVYAAYALYVWLSGRVPTRARKFAMWSAIISLLVGAAGQIAYHLLVESNLSTTPWQITTAVSCVPVAVLGMGAALAHLVRNGGDR